MEGNKQARWRTYEELNKSPSKMQKKKCIAEFVICRKNWH